MTNRDKFFYVVGSCAFFVLGPCVMLVLKYFFSAPFLPENSFMVYVGYILCVLGAFFAIWSNVALVRIGKGGAGVIGPIKLMTETTHLVTTGPYALCRNPMHLGVILFYLGIACVINSLASLVIPLAMIIFAYVMAVFFDEVRLQRDFPEEYASWSSQVPRFIPKINRFK